MTGQEENPRSLLLKALQECPGGRVSVALLRTAALHLYTWRASGNAGNDACSTAAAVSMANSEAADERHAESLLARAVELEPFHVATLTALAFMLLQRSGDGCSSDRTMARAEGLLEKAIECAGRRGANSGTSHALWGVDGDIKSENRVFNTDLTLWGKTCNIDTQSLYADA